MQINFSLNGQRDKVIAELTEAAADAPESQIRGAIADYITRQVDGGERTCSVSVSVTITGD